MILDLEDSLIEENNIYIYIFMYIHTHKYVHICMYIHQG
jgi:hypothetical protein